MPSHTSNPLGQAETVTHIESQRHRPAHIRLPPPMIPAGDSQTNMQASQEDDEESEDSIEPFSDPVDDDLSDIESFDADDLYGSDPDSEIIWTQPQMARLPPSPSSDTESVWPFHLVTQFIFIYEAGFRLYQHSRCNSRQCHILNKGNL
jgi:hypothetical protein